MSVGTKKASRRKNQRGGALLIVLLLAATLSFVGLASTQQVTLSAKRSVNVNARGEALWRAFAAETLALAAIEQTVSASGGKMSLDDPWASEAIEFPLENGVARLFFADATTCFNPNSFALGDGQSGGDPDDANMAVFKRLGRNIGLSVSEAQSIGERIADWVDGDSNRRAQGAEDDYYTSLPSPYRTGNQPIASVSEVRAIRGVSRDVYARLRPLLCASSDRAPAPINVNMMSGRHAPLLAALLGEDVSVADAEDIIAARPPGGYKDVGAFLAEPGIAAIGSSAGVNRLFDVTSRNIQVRAEIVYDTAVLEMTSSIVIDGGVARVVARRIGAEE